MSAGDWLRSDFLVFIDTGKTVPAYTTFLAEHELVGHVRAEGPVEAATVAAGVTGRVRKYAVLEVSIIDLGADGVDVVAVVDETGPRG